MFYIFIIYTRFLNKRKVPTLSFFPKNENRYLTTNYVIKYRGLLYIGKAGDRTRRVEVLNIYFTSFRRRNNEKIIFKKKLKFFFF